MTGTPKEINCSVVTNFCLCSYHELRPKKSKKQKTKTKPKSRFLASLSYEAMLLFTKSPNHCTRKTIQLVLAWGDPKTTASEIPPENHM